MDDIYEQVLSRIPERRSSKQINSNASTLSTTTPRPSRQNTANMRRQQSKEVSSKGASTSPIRLQGFTDLRRAPSRTYIPATLPLEVLDTPLITHPRVVLAIRLFSPVHMGGATVEGQVHIKIDGGPHEKRRKARQPLSLGQISVTLIGVERCRGRQEIFRALTTQLVDEDHPPPDNMAPSAGAGDTWDTIPSENILPFRLHLPVAMGPPPHKSKKLGICYLLSASMDFIIAAKKHCVRQSREIAVLTVHDRKSLKV